MSQGDVTALFLKYATHWGGCEVFAKKRCSCGYFDAHQKVTGRPASLT